MKILNYGSLNFDMVYQLSHLVGAGETVLSESRHIFPGGKGLNQSVALSLAGALVYHAGAVGHDGDALISLLGKNGVDTSFIQKRSMDVTGHAIIQVDSSGQNCILLHSGANHSQQTDEIENAFSFFEKGDLLLIQNEINKVETILRTAKRKEMIIAFNPSPITPELLKMPLDLVDIFILNEVEAAAICGEASPQKQLFSLKRRYPLASIILTLGGNGVLSVDADGKEYEHGIYQVPVMDTTAAGDTFTGFYLASVAGGKSIDESLRLASAASSIAVSRQGASVSIPTIEEVKNFLENNGKMKNIGE